MILECGESCDRPDVIKACGLRACCSAAAIWQQKGVRPWSTHQLLTACNIVSSGMHRTQAIHALPAICQVRTLVILAVAIVCDLVTVWAVLYALRRRRQHDEVRRVLSGSASDLLRKTGGATLSHACVALVQQLRKCTTLRMSSFFHVGMDWSRPGVSCPLPYAVSALGALCICCPYAEAVIAYQHCGIWPAEPCTRCAVSGER